MKTLLTLAASLLIATSLSLSAKTIKYPEKDPAFSITLPDGWTAKPDKDGSLDCVAGEGLKFSFSIVSLKNITTDDELKTYLPKLAETMGEGAKLKDLRVGEVKEMTTANKVKLVGLNAQSLSLHFCFIVGACACGRRGLAGAEQLGWKRTNLPSRNHFVRNRRQEGKTEEEIAKF